MHSLLSHIFIKVAAATLFLFFSLSNVFAENIPSCPAEDTNCMTSKELVVNINEDFKKIYSLGSAAAISQPPLVIIPKITSDAPNVSNTQKNLNSQINRPAQKPLVAQKKRLDAAKFSHIISILDAKGTDQLHRCLRKISHKDKQNYFSNFSEELSALEELSTTNKRKSLSIRDLLVNSPSKDQCINYLDFILMAG